METKYSLQSHRESGFALLMSLVVMGVLISIGLSVLELSIKQVELSTNVRDSEVAFHAANAGMECSRYWRRASEGTMEIGGAITPTCFNEATDTTNTVSTVLTNTDGSVYRYDYNFTWGGTVLDERCSQITTLVFNADIDGSNLTLVDVVDELPGYSNSADFTCEAGARCTLMSAQGYNKPCGAINEYGTLQREVLLEF